MSPGVIGSPPGGGAPEEVNIYVGKDGTLTPLAAVQCSSNRVIASRRRGAQTAVGIESGNRVSKYVAMGSVGQVERSLFRAS